MKVLLTGCAGFIGSAVADLLLQQGHEVLGLDDLNDAYDPRLKAWRLANLQPRRNFRFRQADIADRSALEEALRGEELDAVLNLAARAGVRQSIQDPWVYVRTNVTGSLNLLEHCRTNDVGTFLLASTSSLYGAHNPRPYREDADTDRPLSPYAASKKGAEAMAASFAHLYGLHTPVLRFFTVYGPAGRPDMSVFRFVRWVAEGEPVVMYGDGSQERDFTYVEDIARGVVAALGVRGFDVINLGGDRPERLDRLLALVEGAVGKKATIDRRPAHPADVQATWADVGKARRVLGWAPRVSLKEGVEAAAAWYLKHRDWAKDVAVGAT